jgi:hypothetical protein
MLPNAVNDCARGMMGAIRRNYDQLITGTFAFTNITASGTVTAAYIYSTGDVHAVNAVTSPYIHSTGDLHADGAVTAPQVTSTGGITATGNVSGSAYICDGLQAINTISISTPGGPATVPVLVNEAGTSAIQAYSLGTRYLAQGHTFYDNGGAPAPVSASAFNVISDARLKEGIEPSPQGLPEVLRLNPVSFRRISGQEREVGFIAQDMQEVLPQAVTSLDPNGEATLAISAMPILAALVGAIKDLSKRLDSLEAR